MFFEILTQFGLPVAAATTMGVFIYIILKYILGGVVGSVKGLHGIIMGLDNRVQTMLGLVDNFFETLYLLKQCGWDVWRMRISSPHSSVAYRGAAACQQAEQLKGQIPHC